MRCIGDRFRLLESQFDRDENDEGRITPAGSIAILTKIYDRDWYQLECEATGGWWCLYDHELRTEFLEMPASSHGCG